MSDKTEARADRAETIVIRGVTYRIDWDACEPGHTETLAFLVGPRGAQGAVCRTDKGGLLVLASHGSILDRVPIREMRDLLRPVFADAPPVPFTCPGVDAETLAAGKADPGCGGYYPHEAHANRPEEEFCGYAACRHHESFHDYGEGADRIPGASLPCRRCPDGVCAR